MMQSAIEAPVQGLDPGAIVAFGAIAFAGIAAAGSSRVP
jgi:hypothetical protein